MKTLVAGANTPLGASSVDVVVSWSPEKINGCDVDASAFLLTSSGKVRGDEDFIFYNQPNGGGGSVRLSVSGSTNTFSINTSSLPADIEKIAFAATIHGNASFAGASQVTVTVSQTATFAPATAGRSEKALILGELYKRNGQWKFRAVGQGFNGGLGPLATSFGVDVGEEEEQAPPPPPPKAAPPPKPKPAPAPKVQLTKITLEKKGDSKTISLAKGSENKEIVINLNWQSGGSGGGFFSSLMGSSEIDLDLGVFWEMDNGLKSVIDGLQFSGGNGGPRNRFSRQGCYTEAPYVWHTGDDLSGGSSSGENILVNPKGFQHLKRLVIYTFIYDGVARWDKTNAVVTVKVPGNPEIVVEMGDQRSSKRHCAICSIDFISASQMRVTKHVTFHDDHASTDRAYNWGMRWKAGSK